MDRVTLFLLLLFLVMILRLPDEVSDHCSEFLGEIINTETEITKHLLKNQERVRHYLEHVSKHLHTLQTISKIFNEFEAVNNVLNSTIDVVTKTLESLYQKAQWLNETQDQLQTSKEDKKMGVDLMKEVVRWRCGEPANACRYLLKAAKYGDVKSAKQLAFCCNDSCADNDARRSTPLIYAATYGHVEMVRTLLDGGVNVETTDNYRSTALHAAAYYGHLVICRLLLDWGAKVDPLDNSKDAPLHEAARKGHLSVVKLLVEKGADVRLENYKNQTARELARKAGKEDVVKCLESAYRRLLRAVKPGNVNTAKILVSCINDSCTTDDKDRNTPLIYAAIFGDVTVVQVLLEGGANLEETDTNTSTALHYAAYYGYLDVSRLLLDWGAKVDPLDTWKETPLHWAAWAGHLSVVKLLVERGADVRLKNDNGQTASDVARREGKEDVAEWLDSVNRP